MKTYYERQQIANDEVSRRLNPAAGPNIKVGGFSAEIGPKGDRAFLVRIMDYGMDGKIINNGDNTTSVSRPMVVGSAEVVVDDSGEVLSCKMPSWNRG